MIPYLINHYLISIFFVFCMTIILLIFHLPHQFKLILFYCSLFKSLLPWGIFFFPGNWESTNRIGQEVSINLSRLNQTAHDGLVHYHSRQNDPFFIAYLLIVFLSSLFFLSKILKIIRIVHAANPIEDQGINRFLMEVKRNYPLHQNIKVFVSDQTDTAFVWYSKNWVIVIPEEVTGMNYSDKKNILSHELVHIIKKDLWKYLGLNLLSHWTFFSLFSMRIITEIIQLEEMITDQMALSLFKLHPKDFGKTLLKCIHQQNKKASGIPYYLGGRSSSIKKRLNFLFSDYILNHPVKNWKWVFLGALLLSGLINLSLVMETNNQMTGRINRIVEHPSEITGFTNPLPGGVLTLPFGHVIHPLKKTDYFHNGIDLSSPVGTKIKAPQEAFVAEVSWDEVQGNYLILNHANKISTVYTHLKDIDVSVDDHVNQGQLIGLVGDSGVVTGPHLHFEIHKNGIPVDPQNFINLDN